MTLSEPQPGGLSRRRRWALGLILFAAVWGAAEVATFGVLSLAGRSFALPGRLRAERLLARQEALSHTVAARDRRDAVPDWGQSLALHPFVGFVEDPAQEHGLPVNQEGYTLLRGQGRLAPEERFTVAIFGGSVAQHLCLSGGDALRQELSTLPQAGGKPAWIDCYALGGYKQPQQVMALAYALARGERIDLVLNLDGFNEVALPVSENLPHRVNPFYPRSWQVLSASALDRGLLRRAGEVAYLEARRADAVARMERVPLRYSAIAHAVWRAADQRARRRIAELERVADEAGSRRTFQRFGPVYPHRPNRQVFRELAGLWARSSRLMDGLCRSKGIPYFHFLQPNQYVEGSKPMGAAEQRVAYKPASGYGRGARRGYPDLIAAGRSLRAEGENYFDLTAIFAQVEAPLYIDDCCHVSRDGTERIAREIAARVRATLGAPQRP